MNNQSDSAAGFSISQLRPAYRQGVSAAECVAVAYDRIEAHRDNPIWISLVAREQALIRARELDGLTPVERRGSLWGIPFAVKDNIDVAGMQTTAACPEFAYFAKSNAPVVERLLAAGAICIGKTNLDQFATGLVGTRSPYGACRNAFDPHFISGGSSAGSAVAVTLGMVSFALGTDTAGSGRVPAAFNNIVGLKPTRGLLSTRGVVPACRSLDCVSIFAQDCADAIEVLRAARAYDPQDAFSRRSEASVACMASAGRFAVPRAGQREFFGDREYAILFEQTIARLSALGFEPVEVDFAAFMQVQRLLYEGPWLAERAAALGPFAESHPHALHPVIAQLLGRAAGLSAVDAFRGIHRLAELRRETEHVWEQSAFMLVPATPTIYRIAEIDADPLELNARLGLYTNFVNLLDLAAINVPGGFRSDGLPFGVSLIGQAHTDEWLAAIGARLHAALHMPDPAANHMFLFPEPGTPDDAHSIRVAVVGAHLSGLPLNSQLTARKATLVRRARTAPVYRLYALEDGAMHRPGMVRAGPEQGGAAIEVEVWALPKEQFGSFVAEVAAPLGIGTIELEGGEQVMGFLCEHYATHGKTEITMWGGWRSWLARAGKRAD